MIGILIAIGFSWLLLYFFERKSILALGFLPLRKRLKQFFIGFLLTALLCILIQYFESFLKSSDWVWNQNISTTIFFKSIWWDFKSVLTEELIFRGALLYILIRKLGKQKGILISAIAFGVYHWFSYGVMGNIMAMLFVFIGTGLMGYAWALAFYKSKSIMLAFGMHLGWNMVYNSIFSKGPLGAMLLVSEGGTALSGWVSLLNFLTGLLVLPLLLIWFLRFFKTEELNPMRK